jgi:hypothetical protein
MKYSPVIYLSAAGLLIFTALAAWNTMARGAYESAEYKVVEKDGKFEVREYSDWPKPNCAVGWSPRVWSQTTHRTLAATPPNTQRTPARSPGIACRIGTNVLSAD